MIKPAIIFLMFSCAAPLVAQTPIDFQKWKDGETYTVRMGGPLGNYPEVTGSDTTWAEIKNTFTVTPDSVYNFTDIIKTTVLPDGTSRIKVTWDGVDYTITQRPRRLVWINTATRDYTDATDTASWPAPDIGIDSVGWQNVIPGINYSVHKTNASLSHRIHFTPEFLDSAVRFYNQRWNSSQLALGNVMEYTLSSSIDYHEIDLGTRLNRVLKQFGRYGFELTEQYVQGFPGADNLRIPVYQYWEQRDDKMYCIEYVMMRKLKQIHETYPTETIWHNDEVRIKGPPEIIDARISSGQPNHVFNGNDRFLVFETAEVGIIAPTNVATALGPGATITNVLCSLWIVQNLVDANIDCYRIFKNWNSDTLITGGAGADCTGETWNLPTWNDWGCMDNAWTTAGCESADDGGSDNSGDGTGADRKATADDSFFAGTSSTWVTWNPQTALAQEWYDGTANENGHALIDDDLTGGANAFMSAQVADVSQQPRYIFTFTLPPEPGVGAGNIGKGNIAK